MPILPSGQGCSATRPTDLAARSPGRRHSAIPAGTPWERRNRFDRMACAPGRRRDPGACPGSVDRTRFPARPRRLPRTAANRGGRRTAAVRERDVKRPRPSARRVEAGLTRTGPRSTASRRRFPATPRCIAHNRRETGHPYRAPESIHVASTAATIAKSNIGTARMASMEGSSVLDRADPIANRVYGRKLHSLRDAQREIGAPPWPTMYVIPISKFIDGIGDHRFAGQPAVNSLDHVQGSIRGQHHHAGVGNGGVDRRGMAILLTVGLGNGDSVFD